jgi:hypothetical protein
VSSSENRGSATNERALEERKACRFESCVSRHVDGELDAVHAMDVETHLAACASCDEHAKLLRAMKVSLRRRCTSRASDDLRAKLSLVLARESASQEDRPSIETPLAPAVASISSASSPSRESLVGGAHDRAQLARSSRADGRSARVAYGVGALAVAAGVALAVAGERLGEEREALRAGESGESDTNRVEVSSMSDAKTRRSEPSERGFGVGPRPVGLDGFAAGTGLVPVANAPSSGSTIPSLAPGDGSRTARVSFDTLLDDLVALHANPLPPETTNPEDVRKYDAAVGVKVRRPTLRPPYVASYRGARLHAMRDAQRTAMFQYALRDGHTVTVYVFNPREMQLGTTHLQPRVVRDELSGTPAAGPIYVGSVRGYSVAAAERRGVGYALATDLDTDDSVKMVATSLP